MALPPLPETRRDDTADVIHGVTVPDPYRWLEDGDTPEVAGWVAAHNARTRAVLHGRPERAGLVDRFAALYAAGRAGAPSIRGGRLFSIDRWGGREQAVLVVRDLDDRGDGTGRVLVDPDALTLDTTAALDWYEPSDDGRLVAFGVSLGGDERSTLGVVDVESGEILRDTIRFTRAASVAWAPGGDGFAYTRWPDPAVVGPEAANFDRTVWWHDLGADPADDTLVFDDLPDPTAWAMVELSPDGRWLLVQLTLGWSRVDIHLIDRSTGARTEVIAGRDTVTFLTVVDDLLVGHTNLDAPKGRVVVAPLADPAPERWRTIVPESDDVVEGVAVTAGSLLVNSTRGAIARLRRVPRAGLAGPGPVA